MTNMLEQAFILAIGISAGWLFNSLYLFNVHKIQTRTIINGVVFGSIALVVIAVTYASLFWR